MFLSEKGPTLEMLDFAFRFFDFYLYTAYAAHYVYFTKYTMNEYRMNGWVTHFFGFNLFSLFGTIPC